MPRGQRNESNFDSVVIYAHARAERELEQISLATGIPLGVLAARVSQLLHPLGSGIEGQMPLLRGAAPRLGTALATVEVALHPHHHAPSPDASAPLQDHRSQALGPAPKSKIAKAAEKRWVEMSKAERKQLLDKMYVAKYGKRRPTKKPASKKSGGRADLQAIYVARHEHKKRHPGVPMPEHLLLAQEKAATSAA